MKKILTIILIMLATLTCNAQQYSKMSRWVRGVAAQWQSDNTALKNEGDISSSNENNAVAQAKGVTPTLSATENRTLVFVKATDAEAVAEYSIARQGDIHICSVPVSKLTALSEDERVVRIEANANDYQADNDSVARVIDADYLWGGASPLPYGYDGTGVVVGVVDIGIDFTHPTFRSAKDGHLRIVRAWDMLDYSATDDYQAKRQFPMGLLLTDTTAILEKGHTVDSKTEWHGTHTMGTATGSGWDTPFTGMAPEADIYAVGCVISSNKSYISSNVKNLNTTTLNTLAFQRIFEYADSVGKPAVVSYSISGTQDMTGEDALLNAYLDSLTSKPGHIIVASIGNSGKKYCYLPKTEETDTVGGIISTSENLCIINISTKKTLKLRITDYSRTEAEGRTKEYSLDFLPGNRLSRSISGLKWEDYTIKTPSKKLDSLDIYIYSGANGFDQNRVGYDIFLYQTKKSFTTVTYGIEIIGADTEAEIFCQNSELVSGTQYSPTLTGALMAGNCGSPAALPSVIGCGFTAWWEQGGLRDTRSSIGPTLHGYIKPDITAPGYKVRSAYNSYYRSQTGGFASVRESLYDGKQYGWMRSDGTSMSTPAVAGTIALWMQAKPTLTHDEVLDVFANTSHHPDAALSYPNNEYGYGEINAYRGLLHILGINDDYILGDVNSDGLVTMSDANAVVNYYLATDKDGIENFNLKAADANIDGTITMSDANAIVNIYLNQGEE